MGAETPMGLGTVYNPDPEEAYYEPEDPLEYFPTQLTGAYQPGGTPATGLGAAAVPTPGPPGGPPATLESVIRGMEGTGGKTQAQQELAALQSQGLGSIGTGDWRRKAGIAGIGVAGQLGQYFLATQQTSADKANEARLRELNRLERQGMLGLSPQEYYRHQRAIMDPIRGQTRDIVRAGEAARAGQTGVSRSAAGLAQGVRESFRNLREAGLKAGQYLTGVDVQRVQAQRQEMGEREAYAGKREQERYNLQAQLLAGVARPIAQAAASYQKTEMTPALWDGMVTKYGVGEATNLARMMHSMNPGQRSRFVQSIQQYIETS